MSALLEVEGLGVSFPLGGWPARTLRAAHDVSFSVDRGELVALVGESGSGKSTIARAIARVTPAVAGAIRLDGVDVLKTEPRGPSQAYRRRVQMVFQDPFASLNPVHRVLHHLERPLRLHGHATGADARSRAAELLDLCGLRPGADWLDKWPHELSGGQRQRVAIARALAVQPDVLLADEPTSMLDVSIRTDVLRLLQRLRDEHGLAVVLITHDLAAARLVADRVLVLYAGQLMEEAPAATLLSAPRHPYAQLLVAASPRVGRSLDHDLPARPGRPVVVDPGSGCPFAARCLIAEPRCATVDAPIVEVGPAHRARCHALTG